MLIGSQLNCTKMIVVNCVFFQCSCLQPWSSKTPINDTGSTMQEMSVPAAQQHQLMCSDPFSGVRKQVVCSIQPVPGLPGCWTKLCLHKEFFADMRIPVCSTGKRLLMQLEAATAELWKVTPHNWDSSESKTALSSDITLFELQNSDGVAMLGQRWKELKANFLPNYYGQSVHFWVSVSVRKRGGRVGTLRVIKVLL